MINLKIQIILNPQLQKNEKIFVDYNFAKKRLDNDSESIELNLPLNDISGKLHLLDFFGFPADPNNHINIDKFTINDYEVHDFYNLLEFKMEKNFYVTNTTLKNISRINFNGTLFVDLDKHKDRFTWFNFTFSKNKKNIIFNNGILNCKNEYGCIGSNKKNCLHDPPWKMFRYEQQIGDKNFDYIALGCSITAGTGIKKTKSWPYLLARNSSLLNLGVPAGGIDQIFLNCIEIVRRKTNFKKMIILLPNFGRKLVRIKKFNNYFNFLTTLSSCRNLSKEPAFNIYFSQKEIEKIAKKSERDLINPNHIKRDYRILKRLIEFLAKEKVDFKISSWCPDTYKFLEKITKKEKLLPMFNQERDTSVGIDGQHPAEKIHEKWVKSFQK